jgi:hypothetical protein
MIRGIARKILLISVVFLISYALNFIFVFTGQNPWGNYTGIVITIIAFVLGFLIVFLGTKPRTQVG